MSARKAYCWKAGDKWYASPVPAGDPNGYRPRNEYGTREALEAEVTQRRMELMWDDDRVN